MYRNVRLQPTNDEKIGHNIYIPVPSFIGGPLGTAGMGSIRIEIRWFGDQHSIADPLVMEVGKVFIGKVFSPRFPIKFDPNYSTRFTTSESVSRGGAFYGTELFRRRTARVTFPCLSTYEIWGNPYYSFEDDPFGLIDNDNNFRAIETYSGTVGPVILFPEWPAENLPPPNNGNVWTGGGTAVSTYQAIWNSAAIKALYGRITDYGDDRRTFNADEFLSLEFPPPLDQRKDFKEHNYTKTITVEEYI